MSERLRALGLERAKSDADRARVLGAIRRFAESIGDAALVAEVQAVMPAANPFVPPETWRVKYEEGFAVEADEGRGTYIEESERYAIEYWQMLSDAERQTRIEAPSLGYDDGRKDADGLNSVDTTTEPN
ncbi:hypothetical protein [Paraburkholderia sp. GAS32]|uniref:hypothetical protein n=1 Tax=Paraburkholderia sp. GAS32 TaxID=3035129 RepID=UPI003D1C9E51